MAAFLETTVADLSDCLLLFPNERVELPDLRDALLVTVDLKLYCEAFRVNAPLV